MNDFQFVLAYLQLFNLFVIPQILFCQVKKRNQIETFRKHHLRDFPLENFLKSLKTVILVHDRNVFMRDLRFSYFDFDVFSMFNGEEGL